MATNAIIQKLDKIKVILNQNNLAQVGTTYMKSITPIDSGRARASTRQEGNSIHADYPYAERLDNHWSDQYYGELVNPTIEFLDNYVQQQITGTSSTPTLAVGHAKSLSNKSANKSNKKLKKK
jgi:hypothetical protein